MSRRKRVVRASGGFPPPLQIEVRWRSFGGAHEAFPPPLQIEVSGLVATIFFDGPHHGTCDKCGKPARCGLSYDAEGNAMLPDAAYVTGGEEPWVFHLACDEAAPVTPAKGAGEK